MEKSIRENAYKKNDNFVDDLMEALNGKEKGLERFINKHLFPKKSSLDNEVIHENISSLKKMNATQQALVKARAKEFEDLCDLTKFSPTFIGIAGLLVSLYALLRELTGNAPFIIILSIVVIAILGIYLSVLLKVGVPRRSTAVFFNTLIDSIDFEKGPGCGQDAPQKAEKRKEYVLIKKFL